MLLKQIIILNISRSLAFKRLSGRRICPNCGKIYNIYFNPPRTKNTCDECGEKLIRRDDDDPKIVNRRLDKYEKNTEPVIKYFKTTYPKQCLQLPADKPIDENVEYVLKEWKRLELY
jgi:adenylate kinase